MSIAERLLTAEEFLRLPPGNPQELVRGKIVMMNVPYPRHGYYCARIARILGNYVEQHQLGRVFSNDSGVVTERDPDTVRGADVAYYSYERVPRGPLPQGYLTAAPELVFEVRSPSDRWSEIQVKVGEYHLAGVMAVAVLDPDSETLYLYCADAPPQILAAGDVLTLPTILGEFRVRIAELLEQLMSNRFDNLMSSLLPADTGGFLSRRTFLERAGAGCGGMALAAMLAEAARAGEFEQRTLIDSVAPLAMRSPHFAARAKRVIFLFMYGGPAQVETFDYKPVLQKLHDQPVPASIRAHSDKVGGVFSHCHDKLMAAPWAWKQHGASGQWVSELLPHTARHVDDLCFIKSMFCDSSNHAPATYQMNTGVVLAGKPSLGSWLTYGLGSENQNLPGYVLLFKVGGLGGQANWSQGFLPAAFQGTQFRHEGPPVLDLQPPPELARVQRSTLDVIRKLNERHRDARPGLADLDGRIAAYELGYRMQAEALDVGDLASESQATLDLYGVNDPNEQTAKFARTCLLARRLSERGVRVVQLYNAIDKLGWDGHSANSDNHRANAAQTDRPIAGLLADLKQRGLLEETLVVWGGEFGRTPMMQGDRGRNHNPYGFTIWLAGGGVQGGQSIGATDEIGLRAETDPQSVGNLHHTLLTALGLRPNDLFFEHNGRPERLTGVAGSTRLIPGVLG